VLIHLVENIVTNCKKKKEEKSEKNKPAFRYFKKGTKKKRNIWPAMKANLGRYSTEKETMRLGHSKSIT
jgi:hypothetical protein